MYCTKCGSQFVPPSRFCASCGTPSSPVATATQPTSEVADQQAPAATPRPEEPAVHTNVATVPSEAMSSATAAMAGAVTKIKALPARAKAAAAAAVAIVVLIFVTHGSSINDKVAAELKRQGTTDVSVNCTQTDTDRDGSTYYDCALKDTAGHQGVVHVTEDSAGNVDVSTGSSGDY